MKFCIGPMSRAVVDATIEYANASNAPMIFIPSRRQIDWNSGYVGWTTQEFAEYVRARTSLIRIERDHGGPGQGAEDDDGYESLETDCKYLDIVHIDPWKKYPRFEDGLEWTLNMLKFCYERNPKLRYEVGTEQGIRPFEVDELRRLMDALKEGLSSEMFAQIEFVVIQCGTQLLEKSNCGSFDEKKLAAMLTLVASYGKTAKEHNGDWITQETVRRKGILGLDYVNIAPEMGEIETAEVLRHLNQEDREAFFQLCLRSGKWKKWVSPDFDPEANKEKLTLICGHYVFMDPEFKSMVSKYPVTQEAIRARLLDKIAELCGVHPKPRVAICFYGQTRPGSIYAIPNVLRYIGDLKPQCDIFIHTWDEETLGTSYSKRLQSGPSPVDTSWHTTHPVKEDRFAKMFAGYGPRVFEVEQYSLQKTKNTWGGRRFDPVNGRWDVSMWRSIQEANKLKLNYADKNRIKYDYTVILRSDFVFGEKKSLADDIKQIHSPTMLLFGDHMNVWPAHGMRRIEEVIWIGQTPVIDRVAFFSDYYSTTVSNMDDPSQPGYRDWQFYAADWIVNILKYTFAPMADSTMRPFLQIDYDNGIDPMNPGFGTIPSRFEYKR